MSSDQYNADELVQPPWMDEKFFAHALGKFEHDPSVKINSLDFKPATKVGDHFASVMYRVTAEYDVPKYKKVNVKRVMIVKTLPFGEGKKAEMFKDGQNVFVTENRMYTQVLPEMERLLSNAGEPCKIGPTLIYQSFEPAPIIILEDISLLGYEMIGKPPGFEGVLKIAKVLAKFHATSMFLQANGMDLTTFCDPLFVMPMPGQDTKVTFFESVILPGMYGVIDELKSWPDNDVAVEKYEKTLGKIVNQIKNVYFGKNDPIYSVLNHCDFHFKNIMVQNTEEGNLKDLLLFDYQCCLWGTPAIDLSYLIFSMANTEARTRRDEIIKYYYDEFTRTLKSVGFLGRIPTLLDLNLEILKNGAMEFLHVFCMILFQFMDFSNVTAVDELFDPEKQMDQKEMQRLLLKNPGYQEILKRELPRLLGAGILG